MISAPYDRILRVSGDTLTTPLRARLGHRYRLDDDLFEMPGGIVDRAFAVAALSGRHTIQAVTGQMERAQTYCKDPEPPGRVWACVDRLLQERSWRSLPTLSGSRRLAALSLQGAAWGAETPWPLRNVILGAKVENQEAADARLPILLATPAKRRLVSAEPLLGPVDFAWALSKNPTEIAAGLLRRGHFSPVPKALRPIDWVIAGGSTVQDHPETRSDWVRSIRDQCGGAGVPFFFTGWGLVGTFRIPPTRGYTRLLDGAEHNEIP